MANQSKLSRYSCGSCCKSFKKYPQLQKHRIMERDAGNGHIHCEICGIDYPCASILVSHFQECHPAKQGFDCPGCGEHCKYVGDLIDHILGQKCPKISKAEWEAFSKEHAEAKRHLKKRSSEFASFIENTQAGSTATWEKHRSGFSLCHTMNSGPIEGFAEKDFPALPSHGDNKGKANAAALRIVSTGGAGAASKPEAEVAEETAAAGPAPAKKQAEKGGAVKKPSKYAGNEAALNEALAKAAEKLAILEKVDADEEAGQGAESAGTKLADTKPLDKDTLKNKADAKEARIESVNAKQPDGKQDVKAADGNMTSTAPAPVAWGQQKNLFPDAAPAKRPTAEQLRIATAPNARAKYLYSIHDPNHAHYDAEKYKASNGRYECPMDGCVWTYDTAGEITAHLIALGEHGGKRAVCPGCYRRFNTTASLAHHAQMTKDDRCRLRGSARYAEFVEEVSGGMVTVGGFNTDMTTRYELTDIAGTRFGPVQNANKWDREVDSDDERL